ncbi:MAG: N5-glutamine methyltransferase family protein [Gemmatimonadota bacterium]
MRAALDRPTVAELLAEAEHRLEAREVEFPDASALWLLAHAMGIEDPDELEEERTDERVTPEAERRFHELVIRREAHEPYQYIVGVADFREVLMAVSHDVFLPRLQSERMCDEIEAWAGKRRPADGWRIADLGTGCGAIAVSLALGPLRPHRVWAVDIAPAALELAGRNARTHGVADRVHAVAGDWLEMIRPEPCLDIVVAVPPYLDPEDKRWLSEETLRWEPLETFFGSPSGTELLLRILDESAPRLRPGGLVALQLDADQVPAVEAYVNGDPDHPLTIEWILQDEDGDEDAVLAVKH